MSSLVGTDVELDVGAVAHGGSCVARHDGLAVFVRHALPGERVRARVTEQRARYLRADAVEVLTASTDRVTPPCAYAGPGKCGGCDWQHASLPAQRELKAAVVAEQLQRLAGLAVDVTVEPVDGDDEGLGWRTRVGFAVRRDGRPGFRRHRSHTVEPVDRCLIAHPGVEQVRVERARWPGAAAVEVETSSAGGQLVVVTADRHHGGRPVRLPELDEGVGVALRRGRDVEGVDGPAALTERAAGRDYTVRAGGFWQVHPGAADALVGAVLAALAPRSGERVLDLYAGAGLFAAALGERVGPTGSVIAVEGDAGAAADAAANLADMPWCEVQQARIDADVEMSAADLIVLDPPRAGAGQALAARLAGVGARAVAYVACDPAALARDVAVFGAHGWGLRSLRAFDLFPMTAHVECVALLEPL